MDEGLSDMDSDDPYSRMAGLSSQFLGAQQPSQTIVGPFVDINMFDLAYMNRAPEAGINPADTIGTFPTLFSPNTILKRSPSPTMSPGTMFCDSPPGAGALPSTEVINSIVSILSDSVKKEGQTPQLGGRTASSDSKGSKFSCFNGRPASPNSHMSLDSENKSLYNPDTSMPVNYFAISPPTAQRSPLVDLPFQSNRQGSSSAYSSDTPCSPILNAHLGIDLGTLLKKADKYRTSYPGRELDKKWLMAYAGKLSRRGEMLDDYRCYVNGCTQKNKRRDHILVHVGSHVDQRPFACNAWYVVYKIYADELHPLIVPYIFCSPMRFLRKNECRRHEAGHSGERPYLCDICPFLRREIVRSSRFAKETLEEGPWH